MVQFIGHISPRQPGSRQPEIEGLVFTQRTLTTTNNIIEMSMLVNFLATGKTLEGFYLFQKKK
jgi:hypothetical protein